MYKLIYFNRFIILPLRAENTAKDANSHTTPARVIMTVALPMLIENNNREESEASILVIAVSWLIGAAEIRINRRYQQLPQFLDTLAFSWGTLLTHPSKGKL